MPDPVHIDEDFVVVRDDPSSGARHKATLVFGDAVEILGEQGGWTEVRLLTRFEGEDKGFVQGEPRVRSEGVFGLSMVDVQQGDGLILETPEGKVLFVDGGANRLFARHAAARFLHRGSTADDPLEVDAIVITHGDADHFDGLNDIRRSETASGIAERKRLFLHPKRVYHNGLVKSPTRDENGHRISDEDRFGRTVEHEGERWIVDLWDDPRDAPPGKVNRPFGWWNETLDHWETRGPIEVKRVAFGMDESELFDFLEEEGITVELQGPFPGEVPDPDGGEAVAALPFLHEPPESAELHLGEHGGGGSLSASHTINGHSVAFRLTYGNVRFCFTGDLNQESMQRMLEELGPARLEAEVVKAPHHGSDDFDFRALHATRPVVAIVSAGDESAFTEYIHPRATLMAALGKSMRSETGVVFVTELAAFFTKRNYCHRREDLAEYFKERADQTFEGEELRKLFTGIPRAEDPPNLFYGFERTNFGIIHVRTDGERVLAFTHSGKRGLNEAYRFRVTMLGTERQIAFEELETR